MKTVVTIVTFSTVPIKICPSLVKIHNGLFAVADFEGL